MDMTKNILGKHKKRSDIIKKTVSKTRSKSTAKSAGDIVKNLMRKK